jgi:hypothetical protein
VNPRSDRIGANLSGADVCKRAHRLIEQDIDLSADQVLLRKVGAAIRAQDDQRTARRRVG